MASASALAPGGIAARTRGPAATTPRAVLATRVAIVVLVLAGWEALARSGLLYRDVVPSLLAIGAALAGVLVQGTFYANLAVTLGEVLLALVVGGGAGVAAGIVLGGSPYLAAAYERILHYLGPTPKIVFFPVLIMWFGVGPGSKVAMGALSCFFPVAISVVGGMRAIDRVLIRVGRTFGLTAAQMVTKVYLPAMRVPAVNGIRIGLGVAMIGTLLAETKLSNQGLGYEVIQTYATFNMPRMYALLIIVFVIAIGVNAILGRYAELPHRRGRG